jgi:hypothetical protein
MDESSSESVDSLSSKTSLSSSPRRSASEEQTSPAKKIKIDEASAVPECSESQKFVPESGPWLASAARWAPKCHPRVDEVSKEVDGYFLREWKFENAKARKKFLGAGFSRVTCLYFPMAKDDRIHFACRLLTVLFLIDG